MCINARAPATCYERVGACVVATHAPWGARMNSEVRTYCTHQLSQRNGIAIGDVVRLHTGRRGCVHVCLVCVYVLTRTARASTAGSQSARTSTHATSQTSAARFAIRPKFAVRDRNSGAPRRLGEKIGRGSAHPPARLCADQLP